MQEVAEQVDGKGFWTIHKSYIVNSSYVSIYKYDAVQMTDGTILPISQKYRKLMKSCLTELYRKEGVYCYYVILCVFAQTVLESTGLIKK